MSGVDDDVLAAADAWYLGWEGNKSPSDVELMTALDRACGRRIKKQRAEEAERRKTWQVVTERKHGTVGMVYIDDDGSFKVLAGSDAAIWRDYPLTLAQQIEPAS